MSIDPVALRPSLVSMARQVVAEVAGRQVGPTLVPGTVVTTTPALGSARVTLDGDTAQVNVQVLAGVVLAAGLRCMVMLTPPHGALVIGTLGTAAAPPVSQLHYGGIANGTATGSMAAYYTANAVLVAPFALWMWVEVVGDLGANAASNTCHLDISDEAGTALYLGGAQVAGVQVIKNYNTSEGKSFALQARKLYAAGATCGFRLRYRVDVSNIYLSAVARVSFEPA